MPLSSLFVLDPNGSVLISRDYRGDVKAHMEEFLPALNKAEEAGLAAPILHHKGATFAYIKLNDLYIIGTIKGNANVALVFTFMYKFIEITSDYFNRLELESIKDNFVVLYELLDEIMDFGYPQTTDPKILQTYIFEESHRVKKTNVVPAVVTNVVSWRPEGIKYRKNELFVDVVESVNLSVNCRGAVVDNHVSGCVRMKVHLSGMPQLRLGLNDKTLSALNSQDSACFEDIKFHQCVQLSRVFFENNIYFIPPDGEFELMSYRMSTHIKPLISIRTKVVEKSSSIEYSLKATSQFKSSSTANNVEIMLPVCQDVDSPQLHSSCGTPIYVPEKSAVLWRIKHFSGGNETFLDARFRLSSIRCRDREERRPIRVRFTIQYFTVTGLQIKYLKVIEKSNYKALTWVRYTTQNGEYLVSFN